MVIRNAFEEVLEDSPHPYFQSLREVVLQHLRVQRIEGERYVAFIVMFSEANFAINLSVLENEIMFVVFYERQA
jgi:hypothetical protein